MWLALAGRSSEPASQEQDTKVAEGPSDSDQARVAVDQRPEQRRLELRPGKKITAAHFHSAERMKTVSDDLTAWLAESAYADLNAQPVRLDCEHPPCVLTVRVDAEVAEVTDFSSQLVRQAEGMLPLGYPDLTATRDGAWLDLALHWDLSRTPPYLQKTSHLDGDGGQVRGSAQ